jgi:hypothetical protein
MSNRFIYPTKLRQRVDLILAHGAEPETFHAEEDDLMADLIKAFCPEWVVAEIARLWNDTCQGGTHEWGASGEETAVRRFGDPEWAIPPLKHGGRRQ